MRPSIPEERRLAFGPFAFKLSPSSEVLAWLVADRMRPLFKGRHVLEVGSGLGFTGIACAAWCECATVTLTDGDASAVAAIEKNVQLNHDRFGGTLVRSAQLMWDALSERRHPEGTPPLFDYILCADCVYDRNWQPSLCSTLARNLRQGGWGIVVASRRCGSLHDFVRACHGAFDVHDLGIDYDTAVTRRFRFQKCFPGVVILRKR